MKALVMEEVGKPVVVKDWPQPKCPSDGAVIRVEAGGICRSDWHLWQGDWGWIGFKPRLPTILGHEFAGMIEEVGKDVKTLKPVRAWWSRSPKAVASAKTAAPAIPIIAWALAWEAMPATAF